MSTPPPLDKRAAARELLAARARRITRIRRRVAAATLASFVLGWGTIAWNGSMGAPALTTASAQDGQVASPAGSIDSSGGDQPAAVTTAQS